MMVAKRKRSFCLVDGKSIKEVFIPEYVAEEYEDFNDGVLMSPMVDLWTRLLRISRIALPMMIESSLHHITTSAI